MFRFPKVAKELNLFRHKLVTTQKLPKSIKRGK